MGTPNRLVPQLPGVQAEIQAARNAVRRALP